MVTLLNGDLKACSEIGKCTMFFHFYQNEIRVEGKPVDKTQSERRDLNFFSNVTGFPKPSLRELGLFGASRSEYNFLGLHACG